jgi:cation/acetate symporter
MFPNADFDVFPLSNPGIVSIPCGFLFGIIGTLLTKPSPDHEIKAAEMEVRAFTGAGAEKAVEH